MKEATTEITPTKLKKKPKWMRILEQQSWQAELIVSGLAIVGSFQLPRLLNDLTDYLLANLPFALIGDIPFYFIWYLLIAASVLQFNFLLHFALRALWIGILGLVSVYPEGIKRRDDMFSADYNDKLLKAFPDINAFNKKLDDLCSTIFAGTFMFFLIFCSISLFILITSLLIYLVSMFLPIDVSKWTMIFLGIMMLSGMLQSLFNLKLLREKKWVKKIHFPFFIFFAKLAYNIFYVPISYLTLTFTTNGKKMSSSFIYSMSYMVFIMLIALPQLKENNSILFKADSFFRENINPSVTNYKNYEDQRKDRRRIINVTIPSEHIEGPTLSVFVPDLKREEEALYKLVPKWEKKNFILSLEDRLQRSKYYIDAYHKYNHFYINNNLVTDMQSFHFTHANYKEDGKITHISTRYCRPGTNMLKIVKEYFNEDGKRKEIYIPFIFDPKD